MCVFVAMLYIFVMINNVLFSVCFLFLVRHNQRSKAMMRDTVAIAIPGPSAPQTAAEPLPAPRTLLHQPFQHRLSADASGLAATIRGPLALELYALIAAHQSATSSSSAPPMDTTPSTSDTPAPSTSTAAATASAIPRSTA